MATFTWDKATQQYRWASGPSRGKFVARAKVAELTQKYIDQSKDRAGLVVESLLDGDISLRQFEAGFAKIIKYGHVNSYVLGLGGTMRYDESRDKGLIGARIKQEYKYLRGFSRAIRQGKLSKAQIRARARQYLNSYYGSYELGRREGHKRNNFKWERDIRSPVESCADCITYENRGWVRIGRNPPIGVGRDCGGSCRCRKIYDTSTAKPSNRKRNALTEAVSSSLSSTFGWL